MKQTQHPWIGLLCLALACVLISSRWLLEEALPSAASTVYSQAAGFCVAAVWFLISSLRGREPRDTSKRSRVLILSGLGFCLALSGGLVGSWIFGRHFSSTLSTLALALTPVVALVAGAANDAGADAPLTESLWPILGGLTGLLMMLTPPTHLSLQQWTGYLTIPVLTGVGAEFTLRRTSSVTASDRRSLNWAAAGGCSVAAALHGARVLSSAPFPSFSITACGLDALTTILGVVALQRLGAVRWSAQFLLAPLLTFLEGLVLLRPTVDFRMGLGLVFLAVGSMGLLLPRPTRHDLGLDLRGPTPGSPA